MKYLAGLKKVTTLLAENAPPQVLLRGVLETAAELAKGKGSELCIPPEYLEAITGSRQHSQGGLALGEDTRIIASDSALENAAACRQEGDPVAFEDGSHVILSLSFGSLTVYKPKLDTSSYTNQILCLKILADLADEAIKKCLSAAHTAGQLDSVRRANQLLLQRNMILREAAMFDDLTGLYNKRFFDFTVESEMARFQKHGHPFGMALIAVDSWEDLTTRLGHAIGDAALYHVGRIARQTLGDEAIVTSYAKERFMILLPDANLDRTIKMIEQARAALRASPMNLESGRLSLSVSAYVAAVSNGCKKNAAELVRALEKALASDTRSDRNKIVVAS